MNKKIFYVVPEDWYFWTHRLPLAKAMLEKGYQVYLVSKVGKYKEALEKLGITVIPFKFSRFGTNPLKELFTVFKLWKIYRQFKPDIVHHVTLQPVIYGSIAACLSGRVLVVNAIAGLGCVFTRPTFKNKILRIIIRVLLKFLLNRKFSTVIVQNPDDKKFLINIGVKKEKVSLILGAGVDLNRFCVTSEAPGKPVLALVSRMIWAKGIKVFVDALEYLKEWDVDFEAWLVGIPDKYNSTAIPVAYLEECEKRGIVKWHRQRDDIEQVWKDSHIAVLPTYYGEGIPKSLLEAAACGRSIVTTDMPGCREVVKNGYNGLLVEPKSSEDLAVALKSLIEQPELRALMGKRSREIAEEKFSVDKVVCETLKVYEI